MTMEKLIKFSKTIRNNWKKSVFGAVVVYYAGVKIKEKYEIRVLMHAACKEAVQYGDSLIPIDRNPTLVTVILNPVANKRKAKQEFEKYCEPLFHLAGLQLDVIQTTSEGNAKEIVENLRGTEAIIAAGGDGTLSETITGLLRRNDGANQFPIGVLPLGRTNTLGNSLFPGGKGVEKVKQLIEASMAIIRGQTAWKDAIKIEPIVEENEIPNRPIYAMSSMEWGAFRDALARKDKYWFLGSLRECGAFIFNGYKNSLTWTCSGEMKYTPPCAGCGNCLDKKPAVRRKWTFLIPRAAPAPPAERAHVSNPECSSVNEICFKTSSFRLQSPNITQHYDIPALSVTLGKSSYSYTEFVSEGWRRLKGVNVDDKLILARTIQLLPKDSENVTIEIDNEEFEVKPLKITLLPKVVKLFCK